MSDLVQQPRYGNFNSEALFMFNTFTTVIIAFIMVNSNLLKIVLQYISTRTHNQLYYFE